MITYFEFEKNIYKKLIIIFLILNPFLLNQKKKKKDLLKFSNKIKHDQNQNFSQKKKKKNSFLYFSKNSIKKKKKKIQEFLGIFSNILLKLSFKKIFSIKSEEKIYLKSYSFRKNFFYLFKKKKIKKKIESIFAKKFGEKNKIFPQNVLNLFKSLVFVKISNERCSFFTKKNKKLIKIFRNRYLFITLKAFLDLSNFFAIYIEQQSSGKNINYLRNLNGFSEKKANINFLFNSKFFEEIFQKKDTIIFRGGLLVLKTFKENLFYLNFSSQIQVNRGNEIYGITRVCRKNLFNLIYEKKLDFFLNILISNYSLFQCPIQKKQNDILLVLFPCNHLISSTLFKKKENKFFFNILQDQYFKDCLCCNITKKFSKNILVSI